MEKKTHSLRFLRKRKFVMILPVLVVPFLTMIFWALGGGRSDDDVNGPNVKNPGLNLSLPAAQVKSEESMDKMAFYERAASDSGKISELKKTDPYYRNNLESAMLSGVQDDSNEEHGLRSLTGARDPNEEKVYQKLAELNQQLNTPSATATPAQSYGSINERLRHTDDVDRLENLMQAMKSGKEEDSEMQALNTTLNKIMDIQHPERVKQGSAGISGAHPATVTSNLDKLVPIGLLSPADSPSIRRSKVQPKSFFGINDVEVAGSSLQSGISAEINTDQTLVSGSVIKMRLLDQMKIGTHVLPIGQPVFGIVQLEGERMTVTIKTLKYSTSIYPVKLTVYDMDGMEGLYIPGAINRDVAKDAAAGSLQTVDLVGVNPSVSAQATSAGLTAIKSLLARKAKLVKVVVKHGYRVILQNTSTL